MVMQYYYDYFVPFDDVSIQNYVKISIPTFIIHYSVLRMNQSTLAFDYNIVAS